MLVALMILASLLLAVTLFWPSRWRVALVFAFSISPFLPRPLQLVILSLVGVAVLSMMVKRSRGELAAIRARD